MQPGNAAACAQSAGVRVRDDPHGRLSLLREMYRVPKGVECGCLPYRRAASALMHWQLQRGLMNPPTDPRPGSPWWRAVNEGLLRDTAEARALASGYAGEPTSPGSAAHFEFIQRPTARSWYLAHNTSSAVGYLATSRWPSPKDGSNCSSSTGFCFGWCSPTRSSLRLVWHWDGLRR